jgi:hypothetical protein
MDAAAVVRLTGERTGWQKSACHPKKKVHQPQEALQRGNVYVYVCVCMYKIDIYI